MTRYLKLRLDHLLFIAFFFVAFLRQNNLGYDYFWHLEAGEHLARFKSIPAGDPFSFTFLDQPWTLHEWLFEVGLYFIQHGAGHYGVMLAVAAIITAALYITYRTSLAVSQNRIISAVLAVVTFIPLLQFSLPRPQLITFLFFAIYFYILIGHKFRTHSAKLHWLPVIMVLWVNMHAGYIIGLTLIMLFIVSEFIERLFSINDKLDRGVILRPLFITGAFCLAASLINPYTYHQWIYPFIVNSMTATRIISEWQSPDFHTLTNKIYLIYLLSFLFIRGYTTHRPSAFETVIPFFFVMMGFVSVRHIPLASLTLLPLYVISASHLRFSWRSGGLVERKVIPFIARLRYRMRSGVQLGKREFVFNWFLLIAITFLSASWHFSTLDRISAYDNDSIPIEAVSFIEKAGITGNVFNTYRYGGYLIHRLYPHSRVYIDGRADLYGDDFLSTYRNIYSTQDGWNDLLSQYPIDYILVENTASILWPLTSNNLFILVYRDEKNSVLVRNIEKFAPIIKQYGISDPKIHKIITDD